MLHVPDGIRGDCCWLALCGAHTLPCHGSFDHISGLRWGRDSFQLQSSLHHKQQRTLPNDLSYNTTRRWPSLHMRHSTCPDRQALDHCALHANAACCIVGRTLGAFSVVLAFSASLGFSSLLGSGTGVNLGRFSYACALLLSAASMSALICSPYTCVSYLPSQCTFTNLTMEAAALASPRAGLSSSSGVLSKR